MMTFFFNGVEDTEEKGEKSSYEHFSPFPTILSKALSFKLIKT